MIHLTKAQELTITMTMSPKQVLSPVSAWHHPGDVYPLVTTPVFSRGPVSCLFSPQRGWTGYLLPCQPEKIHTGPFTILDACWSTLFLWKSSVHINAIQASCWLRTIHVLDRFYFALLTGKQAPPQKTMGFFSPYTRVNNSLCKSDRAIKILW